MTFVNAEFRFRRGDSAAWLEKNPVLGNGEPGYETDTNLIKVGDGISSWTSLEYLGTVGGEGNPADLIAHINNATPHKAYDVDLPSLSTLFENGLT